MPEPRIILTDLPAKASLLRGFVGFYLLVMTLMQTLSAKPIHASNDPVADEPAITAQDREHWSFKPLLPPAVPSVKQAKLIRDDIDRFVEADLETHGSRLSSQASASILLRRVTFDLTGLPPSLEAVQAFAANPTDAAYAAYVEQLLKSERYGEQAAQHWLDLVRYADSDGYEFDRERKHAWKYRDWVIQAFNADMPFDEFVRLQIAGDELSPGAAVATGYIFSGPDMPDINNQDERRHVLLNDITSTFGSAFLGITIGCAQCHDHPYDPISQADFYRLRACFSNVIELQKDKQLPPAVTESKAVAPVSFVNVRGDVTRPGPVVTAAPPRIANPSTKAFEIKPLGNSSGQRAALAQWLTQTNNALFLRSTVNRIWQQHFGIGLAATPNDLGHQGQAPNQTALLDYLATELPAQHWSLKAMHRRIVLSATYRQQAECEQPTTKLSHHPRHRLTGEELRDSMLAISDRLNLKAGGPGVYPPLPPEIEATLLKAQQRVTTNESEHRRRSIYLIARRNLRYPFFDLFDRPDAQMSCGRRNESTTAPQALGLFNSEFSHSIAKALAMEVTKSSSEPRNIVKAAIERCYQRTPTDPELELGISFLEQQTALATSLERAVTDYCLALLNANEMLYID